MHIVSYYSMLLTVRGFKIIGPTYGKNNVVYRTGHRSYSCDRFLDPGSFGVQRGKRDNSQDRAQTDCWRDSE